MHEIPYKKFSLNTHQKNWKAHRPSVCQFELTFQCGLNCKHCYTSCYNKPSYISKELSTKQIKQMLDRIYEAGIIWLCLTGGDPLARKDFLDIYSYAKDKGFIISLFTNGCSMSSEAISCFKKRPPFVIAVTLNAVSKKLYEKISQVEGSLAKVIDGINAILKAKLPLKIKTQVTKYNLRELPQIKKFVEGKGLKFYSSLSLNARLNGNLEPCSLRISPEEALQLNGRKPLLDGCELSSDVACHASKTVNKAAQVNLFYCAIGGGDGIYIDPYGNLVPCVCIREPKVNLLNMELAEAHSNILNWIRISKFNGNSKCKICSLRKSCYNCPGKALLEKGRLEGSVDWLCELAHYRAGLSL